MDLTPPLFAALDWMDDPIPRAAAWNMAMDEVLLQTLDRLPLMRVYRWQNPAVSFGCFEKMAAVRGACGQRELVRRWTGGGIVEHGPDLTYSLLLSRQAALALLPARDSYRVIHGAVVRALHRIGLAAELVGTPISENSPSRACFEKPVRHDVWLDGRKIAGAAQRRTRQGLLHQGSIQIPGDGWREPLTPSLAASFGASVAHRQPSEAEGAAATALAAAKYGTKEWLEKF